LAKYRKAQQELEEAEERCDMADQMLAKTRAKGRPGSVARAMSPVSDKSWFSDGVDVGWDEGLNGLCVNA